jgi:hypothetical protein
MRTVHVIEAGKTPAPVNVVGEANSRRLRRYVPGAETGGTCVSTGRLTALSFFAIQLSQITPAPVGARLAREGVSPFRLADVASVAPPFHTPDRN